MVEHSPKILASEEKANHHHHHHHHQLYSLALSATATLWNESDAEGGGGEFHSPPLTSRSFLQSIEASTIRHAVFSTHRIRVSVSLIRSISLPRQDLSLFSSKTNLEDSIENQGKELLRSCVIIRKQCYVPGQVQRRFRHV